MTETSATRDFNWRNLALPLIWVLFLLPGYVMGPVRISWAESFGLLPLTVLLELMGGATFGIWGGIISPLLASALAHSVHPALPLPLLIQAVLVRMANAVVLPWIWTKMRAQGDRHPHERWLFLVTIYGAVPLMNGLFFGLNAKHFGSEILDTAQLAETVLLVAAGTALMVFAARGLCRYIRPAAQYFGILLEDRWNRWSESPGRRILGATMLALLLWGGVVSALSMVAKDTVKRQQTMWQDSLVKTRYFYVRTCAGQLGNILQRQRKILELSSWMIKRLLFSPDQRSNFLLDVLKTHREMLNMEFIDYGMNDWRLRLRYFVRDESELKSLENRRFFCSSLQRTPDNQWFYSMGVTVYGPDSREHGWLFVRYKAQDLQDTFQRFREAGLAGSRWVLADRHGNIIYGDDVPHLYIQRDQSVQFFQTRDRVSHLLVRVPLPVSQWELIYLRQREEFDRLLWSNRWIGAIHLIAWMALLTLAVYGRRLTVVTRKVDLPPDIERITGVWGDPPPAAKPPISSPANSTAATVDEKADPSPADSPPQDSRES
ncbi:MAG: cache domain-containing protein [Acidobacteria bacterium]|nr:cache domain-containing protein [Acidobacteriota bacterium]